MKDKSYFRKNSDSAKGKIYLLPQLLTTASLFSGFYSIVSAINGHFFHSAVAIIIAGIFDGMDGRVARMTRTTSHFGMEYDSLCDLVSFGVAPALLAYQWTLHPYGRYGWLAAFLYVATTALRLARFNSQASSGSGKTFVGLPCPAAAGMIATSVLFCLFLEIKGSVKDVAMLILVYILSYLMVSSYRYLSFKHPETTKAKTFQALVAMVLVIMVVATEPQITLFILGVIYVSSGPANRIKGFLKKEDKKEIKDKEVEI
ncbi:MAG: CDP-diacylglycerol--serine O-phosphatidyltransferase [Desulfobulbaceae bacterium]|nr:CDP-diacylglycerol--serine O-phosphatidyltransferase [Desulfobulbaceae bacterium]MCK5437586.1 CDP-diacylglycerol--serine O-phosphatidyltransferase [Desulfobulbaceae bacterium]MCK5545410.1 CDP-diacylglycerol--serine O-phosphatidyltransferase [Desulfobulbaceae bacterium]